MDNGNPATPTEVPEVDPWQEYLGWARKFVEWDGWDESERDYKLVIGERLAASRKALLEDDPDWFERLKTAFGPPNNLTTWRFNKPFLDWCQQNPTHAISALRIIWDEHRTVIERFNDFMLAVDDQVDRITVAEASFLHMANDPTQFPVFRAMPVANAYKLTGHLEPRGWSRLNTGERYGHFLDFLDELLSRARSQNLALRDRLDAQSIVWSISTQPLPFATTEAEQAEFDRYRGKSPEPKDNTGQKPAAPAPGPHAVEASPPPEGEDGIAAEASPYIAPAFEDIAAQITNAGLRISPRTLRRYHLSLATRGFVILAGVSGTGKTWLAESYANVVGAQHRLVSVAPNWTTNEDLIGYYNPLDNRYHDSPFSTFIRQAADAWHIARASGSGARPHHLILDEMNLARVEHYFASFLSAMEVRARYGIAQMDIGGSDRLELTPNLFVIGTVNIDETTHGFADKVWDRAQLVELDLPREHIAAHLSGRPYADDVVALWDAVRTVGPFAYRVVDDIARYVEAAEAIDVHWAEALDEQILQKILPKLKGTKPEVGLALEQLVETLRDRYPLSHVRAQQMLEGIRQYGFASYFG